MVYLSRMVPIMWTSVWVSGPTPIKMYAYINIVAQLPAKN